MFSLGILSNISGALLFLILSVLLIFNWRGQWLAALLLLASILSTSFFAMQLFVSADTTSIIVVNLLEILRKAALLGFLGVAILRQLIEKKLIKHLSSFYFASSIILLVIILSIYPILVDNFNIFNFSSIHLGYIGQVFISILGLILVERLWRNTELTGRWRLKFLFFGIGGIFAYELFLYSDAVLFNRLETYLLDARGAINAICVPLIAVSIARNPDWKIELFVSRHVIYHSTAILGVGIYLIVMALVGYYVRNTGAEWGATLQIIFLFGAMALLIVLFASTELRARLKIFITKHFYKNKYDYREEWLGFAHTLASSTKTGNIYSTIIKAVSEIIKSPGGALWLKNSEGHYLLMDKLNFHEIVNKDIRPDEEIVTFLNSIECVVNLDEHRIKESSINGSSVPEWLMRLDNIWLILPFYEDGKLFGFMGLRRPHGNVEFNWEDIDLMKTVGFQTSAYISLFRTSEALSEARQFETFNRLSAFMVHDIKNIVAQLTFIFLNYPKYENNEKFIKDAMETIKLAVVKMNKLLASLGKRQTVNISSKQKVNLIELLENIICSRQIVKPAPILKSKISDPNVWVDKDKLHSALQHLIQNAQESTQGSGNVWIYIEQSEDNIMIKIVDDGCGMDELFVNTRLFKPFDTTKGNAGMGIGVYESRELIREIGGSIKVDSRLGEGTTFTVILLQQDETSDSDNNT
ncbi:MAG: putative PEP-CTERM system histidine kinase [Gammaproteobacteria bacterium]